MTSKKKNRIAPARLAVSRSSSRRRLLRGGVIAGVALPFAPSRWSVPIVESVLLPAHAATSGSACTTIPDLTLTLPLTDCTPSTIQQYYFNFTFTVSVTDCSIHYTLSDPTARDTNACYVFEQITYPDSSVQVETLNPLTGTGYELTSALHCTSPEWVTHALGAPPSTCSGYTFNVGANLTNGVYAAPSPRSAANVWNELRAEGHAPLPERPVLSIFC